MLKANVLFLRLDLSVSPLNHNWVANLVSIRMHDAHWNSVNITKLDGCGVDLTCSPPFKTDWFLELGGDSELIKVHIAGYGHSGSITVNAELIRLEIRMHLHLVVVAVGV